MIREDRKMISSRHEKKVDNSIVKKCMNDYKIIPARELVQIIMDENNTFLNFRIGYRNAEMSIKPVTDEVKDIVTGVNKILLNVTYSVNHERKSHTTEVVGNYSVTVKLSTKEVLTITFDSYVKGISIVDKAETLMEYSLKYAKGVLMIMDLSNFYVEFTNKFRGTIKEHFPSNLEQLKSITDRKNYDGYIIDLVNETNRVNKKERDVCASKG